MSCREPAQQIAEHRQPPRIRLDEAFDIKCDTLNIIAIVRQRGDFGPQDFHASFEKRSAGRQHGRSRSSEIAKPGGRSPLLGQGEDSVARDAAGAQCGFVKQTSPIQRRGA